MIGQTLGHYRILEKIGAGGMGEVYRARDERLGREVAVKVLPPSLVPDESVRKRLRKEAQALSKLNHPNIEILFELGSKDGAEFLVVEYVPGVTLSDRLAQGPMPEREIARLGVQLANGLAAAHSQGIVHCDLKPSNLRTTPDGRLKILDFGIAKSLRVTRESSKHNVTTESTTGGQGVVGTLPYMAPEQLRSEPADARSDLYSAGAVLYEMATGQRAFRDGVAPRLTDAILHQAAVPPRAVNASISPELERIILKCLQKEPENRYQSAAELEVDLRQLATIEVPRSGTAVRRLPIWRRHPGVATALAVVLSAIVVGLSVGRWWEQQASRSGPGRIQSLAVLPLQNFSGDLQKDYFADGMTDQLIADLSQISALRVISRTTMMQYKGTRKPLPQIARELSVDAVIEGSVLSSGNRIRITAQLIQGSTDKHLWAQSYERDGRDVLKLQGDVASAIADEIRIAVTQQERARLTHAPPVIPAAYDAYLKGRYHWHKGTEQERQQARQYFEQAAQIDPNYASAYAGLADYYWSTDALPPRVAMPQAKQYALKALEIDPTLAEAHTSLGAVRFLGDWNWPEAEGQFKRALELSPGDVEAHRIYSAYLSAMGRGEEALAEARRAQELDPLSIPAQVTAGWTFYYARRYDQAVEQCGKMVDREPDFANAHDCLGLSYLAKKMYEKAIAECQRAVNLSGNDLNRAVGLARAQALAGNQAAARKALNELSARTRRSYVPASLFAQIHLGLGEKKQGLAWLETAYADRDQYLTRLKVEPAFDSVRSDPAFQDLMRRLGLPP
ncbi:MAG: protein kinase [Terriglobia bacterium]|jgi:serine/threonine-protein kinase